MENGFKAPPVPPKAPTPVFMPKEHPQETQTKGLYDDNFCVDFNLPAKFLTTKMMAMVIGGVLLVGVIFGATFFGGSDSGTSQQQQQGLQGIVPNPDLTKRTDRCGIAEKGQACLLYIMNSSRYDKTAEDFFEEAAATMGIGTYAVSMVNVRYAKQRIRPGYIAQIKIPDVR